MALTAYPARVPTTIDQFLALSRPLNARRDFGAVNDGVTDTTVQLQAAIDSTLPGETLFIPAGSYLISRTGTAPQCLLSSKPITMVFERGARILMDPGVPNTVDGLRLIAPVGGPGLAYRIEGLYMLPASGTPGRYGLCIDATLAPIFDSFFDRMQIEAGLKNLAVLFPASTGDGFFTSQFWGCRFGTPPGSTAQAGGVLLANAGDSTVFYHCTHYGDNVAIDASIVSGAHLFAVYQSNSSSAQGFMVLRAGDNVRIRDCNLEGLSPTAGTTLPAEIYIQGTQAAPCTNVHISGNTVSTGSSAHNSVNRAIQVDWAQDCYIDNHWTYQAFQPTVVGSDERIYITANALRTRIGRQVYLDPVGVFDSFSYLDNSATTIYDTWDSEGDGTDGNAPAYRVLDKRSPVATHGAQVLLQGLNQSGYIDLVIGTPNTTVTSAAHPFTAANSQQALAIVAGGGFIGQTVKIVSVAGGVATCSAALGTSGSTGGVGTAQGRVNYAGIASYLRNSTPGAEIGDLGMNVMASGSFIQAGRFTAEGGLITGYVDAGLAVLTAPGSIGAGQVPAVLDLNGTLGSGANAVSGISIAATLTTVPTVLFVFHAEPGGMDIWTSPSTGAGPSKRLTIDGHGIVTLLRDFIPAGTVSAGITFNAAYASGTSAQSIDHQINSNPATRIVIVNPGHYEFWTTPNSATTAPSASVRIDPSGLAVWNGTAWVAVASGGITSLTGAVTATGPGAVAATITPTTVAPGTYGDATHALTISVNAAGQLTAAAAVAITAGSGGLLAANNLSDVASPATAVQNLAGVAPITGSLNIANGTSSLLLRSNPTTNVLEFSSNGGSTWFAAGSGGIAVLNNLTLASVGFTRGIRTT